MSGSKRMFRYVSNGGLVFAIEADESNVESIHSDPIVEIPNDGLPALPVARRCRRARYAGTNLSRVIPVLTPGADLENQITLTWTSGSGAAQTEILRLKKTYDEEFPLVGPVDTALNDGDVTG